jgi:hypothetical protein
MLSQPAEMSFDGRHALLALKASLAAIALDRRLRDPNAPIDDVRKLVGALQSTIEPAPAGPSSLLDPTAVELWTRALTQAQSETRQPSLAKSTSQPSSLPEVSAAVQKVIAELDRVPEIEDTETLVQLRDLCLALSQSAQLEMPSVFVGSALPDI